MEGTHPEGFGSITTAVLQHEVRTQDYAATIPPLLPT